MNKKVSFLIERPSWVRQDTTDDHVVYYNNIEAVLRKMGHPYKVIPVKNITMIGNTPKYDGIFLSFHTSYTQPNLWNLKKGYIRLYMNFDQFGYSGWSEMAKSKQLFELSQQTDKNKATDFVNSFIKEYKASNGSKYVQSSKPINFDQPFLFVACQRPLDTVSQLARIGTYELASLVAHKLSTEIDIVIKLHPKEVSIPSTESIQFINDLKDLPNVYFSDASIHKLIPKSSGVITVNSGTGFEALLYGKHVFTSGDSDYEWVTHKLVTEQDIVNIPNIIKSSPNVDSINKFLFYMMTEHFVKADDLNSIQKHLKRAINEYKKL